MVKKISLHVIWLFFSVLKRMNIVFGTLFHSKEVFSLQVRKSGSDCGFKRCCIAKFTFVGKVSFGWHSLDICFGNV